MTAQSDTGPTELTAEELAYGIPMQPATAQTVHTALLPDAVYRGSVGRDLADIRVFNADGEPLSHAVRALPRPMATAPPVRPVPWFVVPTAPDSPSTAARATTLRIERDARGAVIDLQVSPDAPDPNTPGPLPTTYLVDLRSVDRPLSGLRITLADGAGDFTLPVAVDASENLTAYRRNVAKQTLVNLRYGGQQVQHDEIALPQVAEPFVRLRFSQPPPATVAAVMAITAPAAANRARTTVQLVGKADPTVAGRYHFDAGGELPADRIRVRLPDDNTLVRGALHAMQVAGELAPGQRPTVEDTFYRVVQGGERFHNASVAIPRQRARHWVLQIDGGGGGLGQGMPTLELSRVPDQLLFIARGPAPYLLAYGHHSAAATAFDPAELLQVLPDSQRQTLTDMSVELGSAKALAGPDALQAPPPYGNYALWALLVCGVLAVLGVALRMLRRPD